jgi:hypothetical protein
MLAGTCFSVLVLPLQQCASPGKTWLAGKGKTPLLVCRAPQRLFFPRFHLFPSSSRIVATSNIRSHLDLHLQCLRPPPDSSSITGRHHPYPDSNRHAHCRLKGLDITDTALPRRVWSCIAPPTGNYAVRFRIDNIGQLLIASRRHFLHQFVAL